MGHHLETIEDMAQQERRKHKKKKKNKKGAAAAEEQHEQDEKEESSELSMEHDETETIFEHGGNDDDDTLPTLPSADDVKNRMTNVVSSLQNSFRSIRGSEPTPELFESIPVQAYDSTMPLSSLAQVIISTPTRVLLNCFDPSTASAVRDAVRDTAGKNLKNLNPQLDEQDKSTIIVPMPRPSAETRKNVVKELNKMTEVAKMRIRRIRRGAQDVVKRGKDGKMEGVSKDDAFRVGKEIDGVTEEMGKMLDEVLKRKTEDVMAV